MFGEKNGGYEISFFFQPHPYRRASCQPAPAYRPVVEKREEVVEVDMEDVEPQREIYQKHLTAEAKKDAEECGTELNLSTEDLDRAVRFFSFSCFIKCLI